MRGGMEVGLQEAHATSYDAVPYASHAFAQTHPDRLCTIARILGVAAVGIESARVLELGCASGGNLIPMAEELPGATFLGIDLSKRQIEEGQKVVADLGLANIRLEHRGIDTIAAADGQFDYIICHGVYSWVPPQVQDKILEVCAENLSPTGVAYVSYNTYPGWHLRGAVREMLKYHAARFADPTAQVQQARALLDFLAEAVVDGEGPFGAMIKQERQALAGKPDSYLLHEHLEEQNLPVYFHEFVDRARSKGLEYLSEAQFSAMGLTGFKQGVEQTLTRVARDRIHLEQFMDFLRNRTFRQTLLCHARALVRRIVHPEALLGRYIASPLKPKKADLLDEETKKGSVFVGPGTVRLVTNDPLMKGAMEALAQRWPAALRFEEMLESARQRARVADEPGQDLALARRLLEVYLGGVLEVSGRERRFATKAPQMPRATRLAQYQARHGRAVVNLRHQTLTVSEPAAKLLALLDGTRDRAELRRRVGDDVSDEEIEEKLAELAQAGFLLM